MWSMHFDPNPTTITDTAICKEYISSNALYILRLYLYHMQLSCIDLIARDIQNNLVFYISWSPCSVVRVLSASRRPAILCPCAPLHIHRRPKVLLGLTRSPAILKALHAAIHVNILSTSLFHLLSFKRILFYWDSTALKTLDLLTRTPPSILRAPPSRHWSLSPAS